MEGTPVDALLNPSSHKCPKISPGLCRDLKFSHGRLQGMTFFESMPPLKSVARCKSCCRCGCDRQKTPIVASSLVVRTETWFLISLAIRRRLIETSRGECRRVWLLKDELMAMVEGKRRKVTNAISICFRTTELVQSPPSLSATFMNVHSNHKRKQSSLGAVQRALACHGVMSTPLPPPPLETVLSIPSTTTSTS